MLPDMSQISITIDKTQVHAIDDANGHRTRFGYHPFNEHDQLLAIINYPTGLVSRYEYIGIKSLALEGSVDVVPAVIHHYHLGPENKILSDTEYRYGAVSSQTYTGSTIQVRMGGSVNRLMGQTGATSIYR